MCKVYNQIGSLTTIKSHLRNHNVVDFSSLNELIAFQDNYSSTKQQIIANHSILIGQEKSALIEEIAQLKDFINVKKSETKERLYLELNELNLQLENTHITQSNILQRFITYFKRRKIKDKIRKFELSYDSIIANSIQQPNNTLTQKNNRYQFLISNFSDAVNQSSFSQIRELERKKYIIDEINTSIYGAIGESKVSKCLEKLSDDYILINDFCCSFYPPIYNKQKRDYIKSIQIDHLLVSPSGIFLIETKNWSEHSLNNLSLRSPIEQIRRTNFALFKILSNNIVNTLDQHHWGDKKIPIRNLIVLVNQKPKEEFQYVKILTLKELCNYVEYFNPIFSDTEIQTMAKYLLSINEQNS